MKPLNFCTLFDSNYLSRGLVLYDSLEKYCRDFHLYVFAFDQKALEVLNTLRLPRLTVISLAEFEDAELLRVKKERSRAEYCWTCTSSTIAYVLDHFPVENCTYLDADLRFYSDPGLLIDEMEASGKSVLITSHRYTLRYDQSLLRGKYCVQFMYFKNNTEGREVLSWWRDRCIEWCYNRVEDGKFGDQKYLDDWTTRFSCVHDLQHPGGGLAPWNCQQYLFKEENGRLYGITRNGVTFQVVFFHFHGVKVFEGNRMIPAPRSYSLSAEVREKFYHPYFRALLEKGEELQNIFPDSDFHATAPASRFFKEKLLVGHYSWFKRNVWRRIFPPRIR